MRELLDESDEKVNRTAAGRGKIQQYARTGLFFSVPLLR